MDTAFAWVGKIVEWFGKFIPQIKLVRSTHGGVKFVGGKVKKLRAGLNVYWPLTTEIEVMPTARQTKNLVTQVLTTKDKQAVTLGVVMIYYIKDVELAIGRNYDINDTIYDIGQCALVGVVAGQNYDDILLNCDSKIRKQLTLATRERLRPFGVNVIRCAITDFARCRVIKRLTGS